MNSLPDQATVPPWWADSRQPTNEELVRWLTITSPENRDWWLDRIKDNSEVAGRCFEQGHDRLAEQIDYFSECLRKANARIDRLERHYNGETE